MKDTVRAEDAEVDNMAAGIHNFEIIYDRDEIHAYEKEIVSEGICSSFIPASFFREDDKLKVIYTYDGYLRIRECRFREIKQVLNLVERVLEDIEDAMDLFIDINRISFSIDTVFYDQRSEDVRMAFLVAEDGMVFSQRIAHFIAGLTAVYDGPGRGIIDRLSKSIKKDNISFETIRDTVSEVRAEVIRLGIV